MGNKFEKIFNFLNIRTEEAKMKMKMNLNKLTSETIDKKILKEKTNEFKNTKSTTEFTNIIIKEDDKMFELPLVEASDENILSWLDTVGIPIEIQTENLYRKDYKNYIFNVASKLSTYNLFCSKSIKKLIKNGIVVNNPENFEV